MLLMIFVLFLGFSTLSLSTANSTIVGIIDARLERRETAQVEDAARLAKLFLSIYNRYPTSQLELTNFAGSVGEFINTETLRYVYVPSVIGSLFQYERVIIYVQDTREIVTDAQFQSLNTCGTGLNDDAGYCAPLDAKYTVLDANAHYQSVLRTINFRMNEAFYKISQAYDGRGDGFPRRKADGVVMAPNTTVTLAEFVGFIGAPSTCTGVFPFGRMFINCSDMFDEFGSPILYYYRNSREIFLVAQTTILSPSGTPISVSRYARV